MSRAALKVRVETRAGDWEVLGVDRYRGIHPQGLLPAYDGWGPSALTFTLRRDPNLPSPELEAYTPLEVLAGGGEVIWGGWIMDTPGAGGDDATITVNARGWQFDLDHDQATGLYVHSDLTQWENVRERIEATLTRIGTQGATVETGPVATLGWVKGSSMQASNAAYAAIMLDCGEDSANWLKRLSLDFTRIGGLAFGNFSFTARNNASPDLAANGASYEDPYSVDPGSLTIGASNTLSWTFTTPRRYVGVCLFYIAAYTGQLGEDNLIRITGARGYKLTAYESGNQSNFKASNAIGSVLPLAPRLDQSTADITATALNLPHYAHPTEEKTPRQTIEEVNAFHGYRARVTAFRRLQFLPQSANPALSVDVSSPGADFQDTSLNAGGELYSKVIARGRTGAGLPLRVVRLASDIGLKNALTARGLPRTIRFEVAFPVDVLTLTALADRFLAINARNALKGPLEITSDEVVQYGRSRTRIPMHSLGQFVGEQITLENLIEPVNGHLGRVGTIVGVTFADDDGKATLTLDNERKSFEALLARMGVVTG